MGKLDNRVAVITGGARGIGRAAADRFVLEGATVVIWDINVDDAQNDTFEYQQVDITDYSAVEKTAEDLIAKHGRIDILINNAGITRDATLAKMTPEQWQQVIDVNLTGVFNCTRALAPRMAEARYGRIINTSSVVGLYGNFGQTNYVATKSGVIGMTKVWAREFGRKGITVNAVAPGFIATEMIKSVPEKVINMVIDKTPVQRLGTPEDIANAYLFLAGDEASFVNGTVLSVDGGFIS
jgi:3-oxoacyl-[acyl-carrier protein] reductase